MSKFFEGSSAGWSSGAIGRQIARHDRGCAGDQRSKIPTTTQIGRIVDVGRRTTFEVWISARGKLRGGARRMAAVAFSHCVHQVAAESDQRSVLAVEIERHRGDFEATLNQRGLRIALVVICVYLCR